MLRVRTPDNVEEKVSERERERGVVPAKIFKCQHLFRETCYKLASYRTCPIFY